MIHIQPAAVADYDLVKSFLVESWVQTYPWKTRSVIEEFFQTHFPVASMYAQHLGNPAHVVLTIQDDTALLGVVMAERQAGTVFLDKIYVHHQRQGQGLGSQALGAVLDWASDTPVTLLVNERLPLAHRFYQKHGFVFTGHKETPILPDGRAEVLLQMQRR